MNYFNEKRILNNKEIKINYLSDYKKRKSIEVHIIYFEHIKDILCIQYIIIF